MKKQKIIIFKKLDDLQQYCANAFIKQVKEKPNSIIGFATGVSPIKAYELIIKDHEENGTSWKNVVGFNLDELVGIDSEHPKAFIKQMKTHLYNKIDIKEENINIPNCQAKDPYAEAKKYEATIKIKGPIDFQYISLGINGHMAYNEPGTSLDSHTHVAKLTPETIINIMQKNKFQMPKNPITKAITMGIRTLLEQTNKIIMVSFGKHKAKVTRIMIEEKPNTKVTASALQNHSNCTYILDEDAASKLSQNTLKNAEIR